MAAGVGIAAHQRRAVLFAPIEKSGVADQAIFDDLGIAGADLARRQRIERRRIDQHEARLMEGADQILARRRIDRGLAPHRRIDLGEQAGRDLDEVAAALEDRRREADQIADHAAAQRDDVIAPFDPAFEQRIAKPGQFVPALGSLARRQHDRIDAYADGSQPFLQPGKLRHGKMLVGDDDEAAAARIACQPFAGAIERACFHAHLIAAVAQRHRDGRHCARAFMIASTVSSCGCASLRIWMGASA